MSVKLVSCLCVLVYGLLWPSFDLLFHLYLILYHSLNLVCSVRYLGKMEKVNCGDLEVTPTLRLEAMGSSRYRLKGQCNRNEHGGHEQL